MEIGQWPIPITAVHQKFGLNSAKKGRRGIALSFLLFGPLDFVRKM
jgi:hypothetical protein